MINKTVMTIQNYIVMTVEKITYLNLNGIVMIQLIIIDDF